MMRLSKNDKTVTLETSAWWNSEDEKIHISSRDPKFILTVGNNPEKKRGHLQLFRELTKALKKAGAPVPEEAPSKSN
jgi:hypothetical protein